MKLYFSPGACSLSTHIALEELGVPYEVEQVDLKTKQTKSGKDFRAINPKGYVPALEVSGGELLTEAGALLQYIGDQKPEAGIIPKAGTMQRHRVVEWLTFIGTEVHKAFGPLFHAESPDETKKQARERIALRFGYVEEKLAGKSYLMGDTFSVADAYLFVMERWAAAKHIEMGAAMRAHFERMGLRPAVRAALSAEGLTK